MKKLIALSVVGLFALPALAEEGPGGPKGMHKGAGHFIEKVDSDKDGKVSRAEFQAKGDAMFKEADSNNDGFITKDEAEASHAKRRAKWQARKAEWKKTHATEAK